MYRALARFTDFSPVIAGHSGKPGRCISGYKQGTEVENQGIVVVLYGRMVKNQGRMADFLEKLVLNQGMTVDLYGRMVENQGRMVDFLGKLVENQGITVVLYRRMVENQGRADVL
ncbi:MAG: hypothetical protein V1681_03280 [Candidatus Neomarinimicrobiota bacterium]